MIIFKESVSLKIFIKINNNKMYDFFYEKVSELRINSRKMNRKSVKEFPLNY